MFSLINTYGDDVLFVYYKDSRSICINFPKGKHYRFLIDYVLDRCAIEFITRERVLKLNDGFFNYYELNKFFYDNCGMKIINNNFHIETHRYIAPLYNAMIKSPDDFPASYQEYKKKRNVIAALSSDEEMLSIIETNASFIEEFLNDCDPEKFYQCVYFIATHNI